MKVPFSIEQNGETTLVEAGPLAIVMYERKMKKQISSWANGVGFEDLATLAYMQLKIDKKTDLEFDDWLGQIDGLVEKEQGPLSLGDAEA